MGDDLDQWMNQRGHGDDEPLPVDDGPPPPEPRAPVPRIMEALPGGGFAFNLDAVPMAAPLGAIMSPYQKILAEAPDLLEGRDYTGGVDVGDVEGMHRLTGKAQGLTDEQARSYAIRRYQGECPEVGSLFTAPMTPYATGDASASERAAAFADCGSVPTAKPGGDL